ncbi:MAG TPA: hypothetical protein VK763_00210 [Terriglobales bacterium]|nr:hypothetical protein [Terriglobales bacterium]
MKNTLCRLLLLIAFVPFGLAQDSTLSIDVSDATYALNRTSKKDASAAAVVIKATVDSTGQHPGSTAVSGPTQVKCLTASGGDGKCNINAPGYSGDIAPGTSIGTSGAGTVTLNCSGTGNYLACSARVGP